jgi:hypothetical protein
MPIAYIVPLEGGHIPGLTPGWPLPQPPMFPSHPIYRPDKPTPPGGGGGEGNVDPGWGVTPPVDPGYGRPGGGGGVDPGWGVTPPVDPGYGRPGGGGGAVDPGFGVRPPVDPGYGQGSGARPTHPIVEGGWILAFHPAYGYTWIPAGSLTSPGSPPPRPTPEPEPEPPEGEVDNELPEYPEPKY